MSKTKKKIEKKITAKLTVSKKAFVLSQGDAPISTVIETAKAQGIKLSPAHISVIRSQARKVDGAPKKRGAGKAAPAAKTATKKLGAAGTSRAREALEALGAPLIHPAFFDGQETEQQLLNLVADLGLARSQALVDRVRSSLAAA